MGRASRWLRSFFSTGRKGRKAKDRDKAPDTDAQSVSSALPAPAAREKRRWSFRRPAAAGKVDAGQGQLASSVSQCFSEAEVHVVVVQEQHAAVAVPEPAPTAAAVAPPPPPAPAPERRDGGAEKAAAVRIQAAFRSYLARKALCALRGMVKLQAMVRGQLVRRQASMTLRRMQALVDAQRRARAERLRLLEDDEGRQLAATPRPSRRSPQRPRSRKQEPGSWVSEEHVRIVEVDDGGGGEAPRAFARQKASSPTTPSALTDASAGTLSGRFDDLSFASASEAPSRRHSAAAAKARHGDLPFPSYMANTESSRAKARSQSTPRQRPAASEPATAWASPSPSCGDRPSPGVSGSGGARRRASLDPLDLPGAWAAAAAARSSAGRVERCASRARAGWSASASVPGSECGSSSTAATRMR
ncbi:hypothetical protein ACP70R_032470 [Stipagrostis hirtigluma subsp. patula]